MKRPTSQTKEPRKAQMNREDPGLTLVGDAVVLFAAISTECASGPRPDARPPATNRTDLLTFTDAAPAMNFVDLDETNFNRRFYRVVSP
jgi:hypothetical protein